MTFRKFRLLSNCPEKTGSKNYNPACSVTLPLLQSDGGLGPSAAFAKFADRWTGIRFWVVSVHLDARHSSTLSKERTYNALRGKRARAAYLKVIGTEQARRGDPSMPATSTPGRRTAVGARRMSIWRTRAPAIPSPQPRGSTASTRR